MKSSPHAALSCLCVAAALSLWGCTADNGQAHPGAGSDAAAKTPDGPQVTPDAAPGADLGGPSPDAAVSPGPDSDDDGVVDAADNCPGEANFDQSDKDTDGLGDVCDPCPNVADPAGDPAACALACEPGVRESRPCADGTTESRNCDAGQWTDWTGCASGCVDATTENRPCADDAATPQVRICVDGVWSDWSACGDTCTEGTVEERACPATPAVSQSRTCAQGAFGDWTPCPEPCVEDTVESRPCDGAPAVSQTRTCAGGLWSDWSECVVECGDGAVENRACPDAPALNQSRSCEGGLWSDWAACVPDCAPGTVQERACEAPGPGHQSRDCVDGVFGDWGACVADAACVAGQMQSRDCGPNGAGTDVRLCENGVYGPWVCTDSDVCENGTVREQVCLGGGGMQSSTCAAGQWGPFSDCPIVTPCDAPVQVLEPGAVGDPPVTVDTDTTGLQDHYQALCAPNATGGEAVYTLRVHTAGYYHVWISATAYDTVLSVRSSCADAQTEVACNNNAGQFGPSDLTATLEPGDYALLVDGDRGARGMAVLNVEQVAFPEACGNDGDNRIADATPVAPDTLVTGHALCPNTDLQDWFALNAPGPGLLLADVTRVGPPVGGTATAGFYTPNGVVLGTPATGNDSFRAEAFAPAAGPYAFGLQSFDLAGLYVYQAQLNFSPSISCANNPAPGCIACLDALEPNDEIGQARPLALNTDTDLLGACGGDLDLFTVNLSAARDVQLVVDIQAMLGAFDVALFNHAADTINLTRSLNGLRYTFTGRAPADDTYTLVLRANPGEMAYHLRVSN